jgi:vacuolar-type H+-ATPase subunit H
VGVKESPSLKKIQEEVCENAQKTRLDGVSTDSQKHSESPSLGNPLGLEAADAKIKDLKGQEQEMLKQVEGAKEKQRQMEIAAKKAQQEMDEVEATRKRAADQVDSTSKEKSEDEIQQMMAQGSKDIADHNDTELVDDAPQSGLTPEEKAKKDK